MIPLLVPVKFAISTVTYYHKLSGLIQHLSYTCHINLDAMSYSRYWQGCVRGESLYLPFLASSGQLHSLALGPLFLFLSFFHSFFFLVLFYFPSNTG